MRIGNGLSGKSKKKLNTWHNCLDTIKKIRTYIDKKFDCLIDGT